jgi:hypothetical protein
MDTEIDRFFDDLERKLQRLVNTADSEAMRHDLLVRPFLTNALTLGWDSAEVVPQVTSTLPAEVTESYVWQGAVPRKRRPDIVIVPYGIPDAVAVVEEKARQRSLEALLRHLGQIREYQYVHHVVWGLLTDGEKWIVQKNNETFMVFGSLSELRRGLDDLRACIGRDAILERMRKYGTTDLLIVRPSPTIIVVASPGSVSAPEAMSEFLANVTLTSRDLVLSLCSTFQSDARCCQKSQPDNTFLIKALDYLQEAFADVTMGISIIIVNKFELGHWDDERQYQYRDAVDRFTRWFSAIADLSNCFKKIETLNAQRFFDACDSIADESKWEVRQLKQLALAETPASARLRAHKLSSINNARMANKAMDGDEE